MKLLAFDTSTNACSVAAVNTAVAEGVPVSLLIAKPMQQGKLILSAIEDVLARANINLHELDAICFGEGPGSYTGLRIAASVAQGLGFTLERPLIPISSLNAMAQAALLKYQAESIVVAVDARANEIYWGAYTNNAQGVMLLTGKESVSAPEALHVPFTGEWILVGNAWAQYMDILDENLHSKPKAIYAEDLDIASAMLSLAKIKWERKEWVSANSALPQYLR